MEFNTELQEAISALFNQAIVEAVIRDPESKIADLEQGLRQLLKQAGVRALSQGLSALDRPYPEPQIACPCGAIADYQFRRSAQTLIVFGWVTYR
jgi:hypothetical protein